MKLEGGEKRILRLERLQCTNEGCRRLHNALPDCLVPYKHYAVEVISGVLDDIIAADDTEDEDYPCETTMYRWKLWMMRNRLRIDGYLKSFAHRMLGFDQRLLTAPFSLLDTIRLQNERWLEDILRLIYNSGGFLVPS